MHRCVCVHRSLPVRQLVSVLTSNRRRTRAATDSRYSRPLYEASDCCSVERCVNYIHLHVGHAYLSSCSSVHAELLVCAHVSLVYVRLVYVFVLRTCDV